MGEDRDLRFGSAEFERALELEPDNPWAKQMLEEVKSADQP